MIGWPFKGLFITRIEAVTHFVIGTVFYVLILFRKELYSLARGVPEDEIFWNGSPVFTTARATIVYLIFLIFWSWSVYDSAKNYRRKQQNLKMLLEDQAEWRRSGGEF